MRSSRIRTQRASHLFSDFRDVSGMLLPFRSETHDSNPIFGTAVTTIDDVELGVELNEGTFELR